ncbi:MAG: exo-alpha-sialidase [Planctomycetota bacterium]|nr:MAG: exo-alpha-sialidase [Planctomycetota bacterium]
MCHKKLSQYRNRLYLHVPQICAIFILFGSLSAINGRADAQAPDIKDLLQREVMRSRPDYIVYVPGHYDGSTNDSHNEHFLVFEGPDGSLMAVWTQSGGGKSQVNRIMYSRSDDEGVTWAPPKRLVGPAGPDDPTHMASWAFPMVSKSGRIYVLYNRNQGNYGWIKMHTGTMEGIYSDDNGKTWSTPQNIPMPPSPYDDPEGKIPAEWIVWQIPTRDLKGGYIVGYSHWVNYARAQLKKVESWTQIESVVEFMRFANVDDNPQPKDLRVSYSAWGEKALRVPHFKYPLLSIAQEPSIVRLPDKRLFCTMRTNSGYIWYSISADDGRTWCNTRPLLRKDYGEPILQPVSCCPIYQLHDGRYILLHHNNRGDWTVEPENTWGPRRPAFIALGEFRPGADQPIWFSRSKQFMDNDGFGVDGKKGNGDAKVNTNIGVYPSLTTRGGNNVLWHPDRKFFLVGKKVTNEFLADLKAPKK